MKVGCLEDKTALLMLEDMFDVEKVGDLKGLGLLKNWNE